MKKTILILNLLSSFIFSQTIFINEFHYDNVGNDTDEFVEIAGPAGFDVTGWSIVRYSGANGQVYTAPSATETFTGTIPNQQNNFGTLVIYYPQNGLQNGSPDGFALVNNVGTVIQFLSYEGTFTATNGPANGLLSTDVGVQETSSTLVGTSISLQGTGPFIWASGVTASPGATNTGQVLPVELSSFSASIINNGVRLMWRTETEVNNYGFEVERKTKDVRGEMWGKIGFVEGYGNSNSPKEYSFIDNEITSGKYSYRLKQIDNDGTFEYSKIIEIDVDFPLEFELSQNYPNPFNPTTTVKYSLPVTAIVKLSVFNILGEEVQILINETKAAGVYTINFNASQLNSGIYFYKLEAEDFLIVRKMNLIK